MEIRKAKESDIEAIIKVYESIHDGIEDGEIHTGWVRGTYPTEDTIEEALKRDDLFVIEDDGKVVATAIINQIQADDYKKINWKHSTPDNEVMVLHTLAVDSNEHGKGYGRTLVAYFEEYAKESGILELRMDTNAKNKRARSLYNHLGYEEVGTIKGTFNGIPDRELVCLEKHLYSC